MSPWRIGIAIVCVAGLSAVPGCIFGGDDPPVVIKPGDKSSDTTVAIDLQTPIAPNTNVIWCGTIQLAWNELAKMYGGSVPFAEPVPPAAAILNQKEVDSSDFDPASYVAVAGTVEDGVYGRISQAMQDKFHGSQQPELLKPSPASHPDAAGDYSRHPPPAEFVAFALLFKKLEFPTPFERLKDPIDFQGRPVAGFGIEGDPEKSGEIALAGQIQILNFHDADNFIIELTTKSPTDRLILAKVSPATTLGQTIDEVEVRIASSKPHSVDPEVPVHVPKVAFDITHDFGELVGHSLLPVGGGPGGQIEVARQALKFQMNENGVILHSEFLAEALGDPTDMRDSLIFDKPFLILMQRADSKRPYFAAWIGNARLMVGG